MLTGIMRMTNVFVLCVLVGTGYSGKNCFGRRRLSVDWQTVYQACRVPFEAAHDKLAQLHDIIDHGVGGSPADGLGETVEYVETRCYDQARESIANLGMLLKENEDLRVLINELKDSESPCDEDVDSSMTEDAAKALGLLNTITEAKQCLAYVEMARRGDPKSLYWAWLNNAGSVEDRDKACGDLVNGVNALMNGDLTGESRIPGARVAQAEDGQEVVIVEDFPLADRLRKAEINAGLGEFLTHAVLVGAAATGSLLAYVCRAWQFLLE